MSAPWSKPLDIDRLADSRAEIEFAVPLAELRRLRSRFAGISGSIHGRVRFEREAGVAAADLTLSGTARLECQRCLGSMELALERAVRVGLIAAEADLDGVPADLEPMLAPEGRTRIGEMVEEELMLALPIVPLHAGLCERGSGSLRTTNDGQGHEEPATQRPFARLNELMKRS
jgi:uncharacterized protein